MLAATTDHPIAFFCAEFGLDSGLPIYAGGLGIVAGDLLKEAADQHLPYVGVGLLYHGIGARQVITSDGQQKEEDISFDPTDFGFSQVNVEDMPLYIKVHLTEDSVWLRCWQKKIGDTVTLFLLDPDTEQNHAMHRSIAHGLYLGTEEQLIKQQLLLSIGGVKLLHYQGIHPSLYHVNEGRPSFLHWQLIRSHMDENGLTFAAATELAKQKTVYTNHTLVEAGNQSYHTHLLRAYGSYYATKMGIPIDQLLEPGLDRNTDQFSITSYALETSRRASAVSQLHFAFCQKKWPAYHWVGITNGVHMPTWQFPEIAQSADNPSRLWAVHQDCKKALVEEAFRRTGYRYDPQRLVITWARRIAGYKQLTVLFSDVQRLAKLCAQSGQEVQLLIAGKAHSYDTVAKQDIQTTIGYLQHELSGFTLFLPDLDIELDRKLVQGSDLWLNTPNFGFEACGTSGMKAIANGVLQCTVDDGWAHEVDWNGLGWTLAHENTAESVYTQLEKTIAPLYYQRNSQGLPTQWVEMMQKNIQLSRQFSSERMLTQYWNLLYEAGDQQEEKA